MMKYYWYKGDWTDEIGNVGDMLTPYIIEYLTGDRPTESCDKADKGKILSIGSIVEFIEDGDTVWGSGLIKPMPLKKKDNVTFLCVRGRNTANELRKIGYAIPEVYGSPCVLMPDIYFPTSGKRYKKAYVPHYVEKDAYRRLFPDGYFIDIMNQPLVFIDRLLECESIVTSSLHAFILAEMYGIECHYLQATEKIIGGYWKFEDYLSGDNDKELIKGVFDDWYMEQIKHG